MDMDDLRHEMLMAYAAGRLPEPVALAIATHVALDPAARAMLRLYEEVGGQFLEELEPAPLREGSLEAVMARLDDPQGPALAAPADPLTSTARCSGPAVRQDPGVPAVLARYLPAPLAQLDWKRFGPVAEYPLLEEAQGYRTRLISIRSGRKAPQHTHDGHELTVVLRGAYHDGFAHYGRGALSIADGSIDHQPVVEEGEECLCLTVTDAPLRLTGTLTRFLNPFIRI